jgi:hypothetical protein
MDVSVYKRRDEREKESERGNSSGGGGGAWQEGIMSTQKIEGMVRAKKNNENFRKKGRGRMEKKRRGRKTVSNEILLTKGDERHKTNDTNLF